jgi:hypothetical protein
MFSTKRLIQTFNDLIFMTSKASPFLLEYILLLRGSHPHGHSRLNVVLVEIWNHLPSISSMECSFSIACQHLLRTSSSFYFPWIILLRKKTTTSTRSIYLSSFSCLSFPVSPCPRSLLIADVKADRSPFRIFRG